jgi:hypothetical protein
MVLVLAIEHGEKRVILHLIIAYCCNSTCLLFVLVLLSCWSSLLLGG